MSRASTWLGLGLIVLVATGAGGCGVFGGHPSAASHHKPPARHTHHRGPASTSSASSSAPSSPASSASSAPPPSSSTRATSSGDAPPSTPPPAPNAGPYTSLTIAHVAATREGTASASGHAESLLLLTLTIQNPSTGNVDLEINDVAVIPVGGSAAYSWNDYNTAGLSQSNSLFWPIDATNPNEDPRYILSGTSATGAITVQVPAASRYEIVWGSPSSGQVAATFSSP